MLAICAVSLVANALVLAELKCDKSTSAGTDAPANIAGMNGCTNLCAKLAAKGYPMGACYDICLKEAVVWHEECMRMTQNNPVKCDTYNKILMQG